MARPRFSIIIPTRNRASIIGHALSSALAQTVDDFEVVVSNNNSDDDTEEVVRDFGSERIRYFRTSSTLGMPDNWQNALDHSRGEWIVLLEDDCVLSSRCLELAEQALQLCPSEMVTWNWYPYYPHCNEDPDRRNQYVALPFDGSVRRHGSPAALTRLFSFELDNTLPRPYNCLAHRSLVERISSRLGAAYPAPAPDYTFLAAALALSDRFTYLDLPLMLSNSGGTSPHASEATFSHFLEELDEARKGGWTPLRFPIIRPWNIVAESICKVKSLLPELDNVPLDVPAYLIYFRMLLAEHEDKGFRAHDEKAKYRRFLRAQPPATRLKVRSGYARWRSRALLSGRVKQVLFKSPRLLEMVRASSGRHVVRGAAAGFDDLWQAMQHLEQSFTRPHLPADAG